MYICTCRETGDIFDESVRFYPALEISQISSGRDKRTLITLYDFRTESPCHSYGCGVPFNPPKALREPPMELNRGSTLSVLE